MSLFSDFCDKSLNLSIYFKKINLIRIENREKETDRQTDRMTERETE